MTVFDAVVVLLFMALFGSIPFWMLYIHDRAPTLENLLFSYKSFESHMEFSWGKLWVYDSRPDASPETPTVVFIHSIGSSIYSWRYQIPEFQKHYRVIAFDLLGFGKSSKPLDQHYNLDAHEARTLELLDTLGVERCALVGCSLGGAISLWLACQHPQRVSHVAVIAPAAVSSLVPFFLVNPDALSALGSRIISRSVIRIALGNGFANKNNITPEVIENYYSPFSEPGGVSCFLRTVETIRDPRIFQCLPTIQAPTLVLWGEKDRVVTRRDITRICKAIPNATTEIHNSGGHHLMEDEPQWLNKNILSFLDEGRFSERKPRL